MARHPATIVSVLLLAACGGGDKPVKAPIAKVEEPPPPPPKETEEDREAKRLEMARELAPEGSTCLPAAFREADAPRLELAAIGKDAVVCAIDHQEDRLLGPVGCWKVDLADGSLSYMSPVPPPGRGMQVQIDEGCARGFCLPDGAPDTVDIVWHPSGAKAAVLAGDELHLFDAATKSHETSFSIRGDKGVTGTPSNLYWVGEALYVEATEDTASAVWVFRPDGTAVGPILPLGSNKPASTFKGSFSILDENRIGIGEHGFSTMTIYEGDTGKRAKLVRKLAKPPCKAAELDTFWKGGEASAKCMTHMTKNFDHLIGATAVAGSTNYLVMLRGPRLGELAVLDAKTLAEKKTFKLAWCAD